MFGIKSIACEYDLRGRKTYEGCATYPVRYEYDSDANISRIDYPDATLAFTHDADGLLTSASNSVGVVSNEYDAATGWLVSSRGADGAFVSYAYHLGGGVASMSSPAGVVSNTLDVAGRKDKLFTPAGEIGFGYCSWNGKLSVVTNANGTITSHAYDVMDRVTHIERADKPTLDLTWNSQYQLISVATNGVFAEGYSYDALGRRVATTTFEGTVHHVYDNNWQCIADVDTNGNVLCSYMWGEGIDNLLAVKIGDDVYTALTDIQGTVWGFTDGNGEVVARWTYDAWGNVLSSNVTVPALASLRYRFQGREWSAVTGLMNFRMRWYDVVTGKWLSKDINGLLGGINLYMFSANNPLIFIDPRGGSPIVVGIGIGVVIIGISIIYYIHKKYEYAGDIEKQMKKGDQGDLKNVVANAVDACKRMLREITSLFGPVPSTTSILTDPIDDFVVRPIVDDVFDPIKPSPSMNEDDSGLGPLKPLP